MHFGCSNLMLHSESQIMRRKAKGKVQYCQKLKDQEGLKLYVIFSEESTLRTYFFCKPISIWRLKHEQIYPHHIDRWVKIHWSRIKGTIS